MSLEATALVGLGLAAGLALGGAAIVIPLRIGERTLRTIELEQRSVNNFPISDLLPAVHAEPERLVLSAQAEGLGMGAPSAIRPERAVH